MAFRGNVDRSCIDRDVVRCGYVVRVDVFIPERPGYSGSPAFGDIAEARPFTRGEPVIIGSRPATAVTADERAELLATVPMEDLTADELYSLQERVSEEFARRMAADDA